MSIFSSLFTGTSGIASHGKAIGVVGDNIANVSTVGYKSSRAQFADVLGGTAGTSRLGSGVRMGGIDTRMQQGTLQQTGGAFDFAIRGNGFFAVAGPHNGIDSTYFTRDGRFHMDDEGYVVNSGGLRLQGYLLTNGTSFSTSTGAGQVASLQLGVAGSAPAATSEASMGLNLDAAAVPPAAFDPLDPEGTSNFSTSLTVYDSLGASHRVDTYFRANGGGAWEWHAMVDGAELTGGTPDLQTEIANGTLSFTTDGALDTETVVVSSADFVDATPGQNIAFDFGDAITTDGGTGVAGATQYSAPSAVNAVNQDGYGSGALMDIAVNDDGVIVGSFSNGQRREIARVALATFASEQGLVRSGDQLYATTRDSGQALLGAAGTGGRGAISGGSLEASNVDLGTELVTLIAYQRAFQANARTVSTADDMLAEIANLKR